MNQISGMYVAKANSTDVKVLVNCFTANIPVILINIFVYNFRKPYKFVENFFGGQNGWYVYKLDLECQVNRVTYIDESNSNNIKVLNVVFSLGTDRLLLKY